MLKNVFRLPVKWVECVYINIELSYLIVLHRMKKYMKNFRFKFQSHKYKKKSKDVLYNTNCLLKKRLLFEKKPNFSSFSQFSQTFS